MRLTEQYLDYLQRDRGYSRNTIATYRRTYAAFPGVEGADRDAAEAWWAARTHLAPASRANELAAVRSFYAWCRRFEHRPPTDDPTHRLDAPKQPRRLPRPISRADLHAILRDAPPDLYRAICLGAYAGLRVSEAAALTWSDIDLEAHRMYIRGKGAKDRVVALGPILLDAILPAGVGNVITSGGTAPTASALQQRVNRHIRDRGVDATFHKLRARFATMGLQSTGNLLLVSRALGHSSPATTAIYAATTDDDLDLISAAAER